MCLGECLEIMGSTLTLFVLKAGYQMEIIHSSSSLTASPWKTRLFSRRIFIFQNSFRLKG